MLRTPRQMQVILFIFASINFNVSILVSYAVVEPALKRAVAALAERAVRTFNRRPLKF